MEPVAYAVGGIGVLLAIGQMAWARFFSREGRATEHLIKQLSERIASQELRLQSLESGLDTERRLRRHAEDKVHALEMYVVRLEVQLKRHGIDVPAPPKLEKAPQL